MGDVQQTIQDRATRLGIDPAVAAAAFAVESGGDGFEGDRLKIRFEPQTLRGLDPAARDGYFKFRPGDYNDQFYRASPDGEWLPIHADLDSEYAALQVAGDLTSRENALRSISMGSGQIMGFNHEAVGHETASDMYEAFSDPESGAVAQVWAFFEFVKNKGLIPALQEGDLDRFVHVYNGSAPGSKWHTKYVRRMRDYIDDPQSLPDTLR